MNRKNLAYVGAALYCCEGTKLRKDHRRKNGYIYSIEFTNNDPKIIKFFIRFLIEIIEADWTRVRGQLFTYPDLNEKKLKKFWSDMASIPIRQFQKSIILKAKTGKFKASQYGTFKIRYTCKNDFLKLTEIINKLWRDAGVV